MVEIDARIRALSPQQRRLLQERLAARSQPPEPPGQVPAPPRLRHGGQPLKWSLFFFSAGGDHTTAEHYAFLLDCARFADRNGFEAIWLPERHFDSFGGPYPAPAILAGAVSAVTEHVGIRAGSVVLPLHDPIRVAEEWAVVDNLSGGRTGVSFASGWHPNDFALSPDAYADRRDRTVRGIRQLRELWRGNTIERRDGAGTLIGIGTLPRPVQPEIPLWITASSSPETWRTGAREGLHVLTALLEQSTAELAEKAALYRDELRAAGRDPDEHAVTAMLHTFVGPDQEAVRRTVHAPLVGYLRSHMELFAKLASSKDVAIDPAKVSAADRAALAELAFERYFTTNGLFGTPESALPRVRELAASGVTEIACLVDFGVPPQEVLANLVHLQELRQAAEAAGVLALGGAGAQA
ncbi:MupA/Atu3671 family FMN-dependent luciferase-like monooxygenase [Actinacidiphila reveromycinica]|uniref:MupA/Atu3671 family FMN-dependent luciferase-like monooxygenase n=1 Tax=Actinacidiphila reveromycinica TaxID=659352 RepID=UPI001F43B18A|nr:MupA/Atu3671 family FMN-dependent luciferase-like monooxygenase [Streptomyces sp. SN-593]